ncbi:MAG: argininosuccinate lyase [Sphingomonadales bacterium]
MPEKPSTGTPNSTNAMWGGRFETGPDQLMELINASIDVDQRLYAQDIEGSRAHCTMLAARGIIPDASRDAILNGLDRILDEIETRGLDIDPALEDIHMHIEARLADLEGAPAGELHTARSRNDQVATDLRMWLRQTIDGLDQSLTGLQAAILDQAEAHTETAMPGFTHLQPAQTVTFGHHLMAYYEMFKRDRGRFADCRARLNESPLGAAALAGTSFPIDREMTARALGFDRPCANSIDAVSDRDFALEFLSAAAITATHLSRLAEEVVLWSTAQFNFVTLPDSFSTGSSIMPQKRNPDAAELVRGKTGRIVGSLNALLIVLKGLPLAYSKDMQEDKEQVFDAADNIGLCIDAMRGMIEGLCVNAAAMGEAAAAGFANATDVADWLVRALGMPFRQAHHVTGRLVKLAEDRGCALEDLSLDDLGSVEPAITEQIFEIFGLQKSIASRKSLGGTAPARVNEAIERARREIQ